MKLVDCKYCNYPYEFAEVGRPPSLCEQCRNLVKYCCNCKTFVDIKKFSKSKNRYLGLNTICKPCSSLKHKSRRKESGILHLQWRKNNPLKTALSRIKGRCKESGVRFELELSDIPPIPECCPILGIKLERTFGIKGGSGNSPSLDRIIPELGYIVGNIQWISKRANSSKNNLSIAELIKLGNWAERFINQEVDYEGYSW